jgi:hypothetical protein
MRVARRLCKVWRVLAVFAALLPFGLLASPSPAAQCGVLQPPVLDQGCYDRCTAPFHLPGYGVDDYHAGLCRGRCTTQIETTRPCAPSAPAKPQNMCATIGDRCVDECNRREKSGPFVASEAVRTQNFQRCMTGCEAILKRRLRCN